MSKEKTAKNAIPDTVVVWGKVYHTAQGLAKTCRPPICERQIYRLINRGMPSIRLKYRLFDLEAVQAWQQKTGVPS